jgi:hypothetical protein
MGSRNKAHGVDVSEFDGILWLITENIAKITERTRFRENYKEQQITEAPPTAAQSAFGTISAGRRYPVEQAPTVRLKIPL